MKARANWIDRAVSYLSPQRGLRRLRARTAHALLQRHYEGAATGRRTQGWHRSSGDANAATRASLSKLRDQARDLVRNNGYAEAALDVIVNNTVGWGIVAAAANKHDAWKRWSTTTACDADGRCDLVGIEKTVMRAVAQDGEVLVRRRWRRPDDGLPLPFQLQVLEADFLDTNKELRLQNGHVVIQGVEFDALGRRAAYWLFQSHPGSSTGFTSSSSLLGPSTRVPAEDALHIFKLGRPGQVRGPSWFAPVLLKFRDFDELDDAQLMKQKIAACLAVITSDVDGTATPLGTENKDDDTIDEIAPGAILNLPPGRNVDVVQPPAVGEYGAFATTQQRGIAAGLHVPYEEMTGDYCVAPETRVLRADLRWVRADSLTPGTGIVAFDEHAPGGQRHRRKWRKAEIVRSGRRDLNRKRVVTDRGVVTVSDEHLFLCTAGKHARLEARSERSLNRSQRTQYGQMWVRADRLQRGDKVVHLCAPWDEGQTHLHGYLKGITDGEGWLDRGDAKLGIAQKPGMVFEEIGAALKGLGFEARSRDANGECVVQQWSLQGISDCLRFLGEVRPTRLLANAERVYVGRMMSGGGKKTDKQTSALVMGVDDLGLGPVVTLETTTRTLITEGLCSHNSQVNFSSARMSRLRHWANVYDWRWNICVPQLLNPVWAWAMQASAIAGIPPIESTEWTAPPMPMIEPDKEGLALMRNVRTGAMTFSEMIRERGYNVDEFLAEYAADLQRLDELAIVLDSDARQMTQAGQLQGSAAAKGTPAKEPTEDAA